MSTLASIQAPSASAASFSSTGPSCLHGSHQSAHRSMITGTLCDLATTSVLSVASEASITKAESPASADCASCCLRFAAACLAPRSMAPCREKFRGCCMSPSCRIAVSALLLPRPCFRAHRELERRRLEISAPFSFERPADLAAGSLGHGGADLRGAGVRACPGRLEQPGQAGVHRGLVPPRPALGQRLHLGDLDLVADPQDLHRLLDRVGVTVNPDDPFLPLLQLLLIAEGSLRYLSHEPAFLDPPQDPPGHRAVLAHGS